MKYFKKYGIKSIKLESDDLIITYQSGATETKSTKGSGKTKSQMRCDKCGFKKDLTDSDGIPTKCPKCGEAGGNKFDIYEVPVDDDIAQLKKIKTYLGSLPSKSVSLEELEQQVGENSKSTSYLPWIIGGSIIGGILVIVLIIYLLSKKRKRK